MGKFLDQHRSEGTQDSEGGFTVSHDNAARKLARFALPRPYAWVSKLTQAAVGWECQRLEIVQTKALTVFRFHSENLSDLPTEHELVSTMLSGKIGGDSPIENFCVGLRSLVEQARLAFLLVIDDGEVEPKPIYAGAYFGALSEKQRLSKAYQLGKGISLFVAHSPSNSEGGWSAAKSHKNKIQEELGKYSYMSPVPISLNEQRVDGLLRGADFQQTERYRPLYISGGTDSEHSPEQLPLPPDFEEKSLSVFTHPGRASRPYGGGRGFSCVFIAGLHLSMILTKDWPPARSFSVVNWLRQGVVVESVVFPTKTHGLGVRIFLHGDDLKTDLTGFQLMESELKAKRETEAIRSVAHRLKNWSIGATTFGEDKDAHSADDQQLDRIAASHTRAKTLAWFCGPGLLLLNAAPFFSFMLITGGFGLTYCVKPNRFETKLISLSDTLTAIVESDQRRLAQDLGNWTCLPPEIREFEEAFETAEELQDD